MSNSFLLYSIHNMANDFFLLLAFQKEQITNWIDMDTFHMYHGWIVTKFLISERHV